MHAQASTLSGQDMQDIAAYLSGQELKADSKAVGALPKAGQTCVACHGNNGVGICRSIRTSPGSTPTTSSRRSRPTAPERKNPIMGGMAAPLKDEDIKALAQYYSKQRPGLCSTDQTRKSGKCPGN